MAQRASFVEMCVKGVVNFKNCFITKRPPSSNVAVLQIITRGWLQKFYDNSNVKKSYFMLKQQKKLLNIICLSFFYDNLILCNIRGFLIGNKKFDKTFALSFVQPYLWHCNSIENSSKMYSTCSTLEDLFYFGWSDACGWHQRWSIQCIYCRFMSITQGQMRQNKQSLTFTQS